MPRSWKVSRGDEVGRTQARGRLWCAVLGTIIHATHEEAYWPGRGRTIGIGEQQTIADASATG